MNDEKKSSGTQIMMQCSNCGYRALQSEIDENEGNCPVCSEEFKPQDESS